MDVRFYGVGNVLVNGQTFHGQEVALGNGVVVVDGKKVQSLPGYEFNVTVNGSVQTLSVHRGCVKADSVIHASTMSGNVECDRIEGNVKTMSGDVYCSTILGKVSTMSGSIYNSTKGEGQVLVSTPCLNNAHEGNEVIYDNQKNVSDRVPDYGGGDRTNDTG